MEDEPRTDITYQWADLFPELEYKGTLDPRIFATSFKKVKGSSPPTKCKTYFCCIVGGDCYGVDVIRPFAVESQRQCDEAFTKVKWAADYYENYGYWPGN